MKKVSILFLLIMNFQSCEEIINEQNLTTEQLELLAPANNSELTKGTNISYNWLEVAGASMYHLQLATPNFSNAAQIPLDTIITSTIFSIDSLPLGNYEWRVKAMNSVYETAYARNGFTVVDQ